MLGYRLSTVYRTAFNRCVKIHKVVCLNLSLPYFCFIWKAAMIWNIVLVSWFAPWRWNLTHLNMKLNVLTMLIYKPVFFIKFWHAFCLWYHEEPGSMSHYRFIAIKYFCIKSLPHLFLIWPSYLWKINYVAIVTITTSQEFPNPYDVHSLNDDLHDVTIFNAFVQTFPWHTMQWYLMEWERGTSCIIY